MTVESATKEEALNPNRPVLFPYYWFTLLDNRYLLLNPSHPTTRSPTRSKSYLGDVVQWHPRALDHHEGPLFYFASKMKRRVPDPRPLCIHLIDGKQVIAE